MSSENAKAVAREVSETIRKGEKLNFGKIIKKRYAESTSKKPKLVTETESYKEEMRPFVDHLTEERDRARKALRGKISKAKYRDLTDAIDKFTKNIQLLSGKETDRSQVVFMPMELMKKYGINPSSKPDSE